MTAAMNEIRKLLPRVGSYVWETDYFQPHWQEAFWGENYDRLLAVKTQIRSGRPLLPPSWRRQRGLERRWIYAPELTSERLPRARAGRFEGRNNMPKRPRIGVIGSTNMDLTTTVERMPVWGETVLASHFETSFGGKGANQAVAAAKLGAEVVMVTNLGDDTLGDSALKNFESYGIDTQHVRRIPNQSTGTATILVDEVSGDNSILIVAGANGDLSSADVDAASEALKRCDLILLQLEIQLETAYEAIRFARKNGVRTVLNPAPARRNLDMDVVRKRASSSPTRPNSPS